MKIVHQWRRPDLPPGAPLRKQEVVCHLFEEETLFAMLGRSQLIHSPGSLSYLLTCGTGGLRVAMAAVGDGGGPDGGEVGKSICCANYSSEYSSP